MSDKYDALKLENQLCFPLYAVSKEIVRKYKPFLDPLQLTYTQYITMMVMWEKQKVTVKELGQVLYLDSGTLTPVLKKLEGKGYIDRARSKEDERSLIVTVTESGMELRERALSVPVHMRECFHIKREELLALYKLLYNMLADLDPGQGPLEDLEARLEELDA